MTGVASVECAFTTAPFSTPSWTDITEHVRSVSIRRGRDFELARYSTGSASLTLDNRDRRFDPTYASSPYYPYVIPGRRIRVQGTQGSTYSLFDGFVESWPQEWQPPQEARAVLQAADGFKMLQLAQIPGGYSARVLGDSPQAYYRMGESAGTTMTDSSGNGYHGVYVNPTFGQAGALLADADTAGSLNFAGATKYMHIPAAALQGAYSALSIELWMNTTQAAGDYVSLVERGNATANGGFGLLLTTSPYAINWNIFTSTGIKNLQSVASGLNNGQWHYIVGTWDGSTLRVYIDGTLSNSGATTGTLGALALSPHFGVRVGGTLSYTGSLDEVAFYTSALSATQIAQRYAAGRGVFPSQTRPARVSAVLDAAGWPTAERVTNGGTETMQASTLTNTTALQHLQDVTDTEAGRLFMDSFGRVRFDGRDSLFLPPYTTTEATFNDNPLDEDALGYYDIKTVYDDANIWNDVRLTRVGGAEQVANDTTSIASYGLRTMRATNMLNTSDAGVLSLAQYRRTQYKDPVLRFTLLTLRPGIDTDLWDQVLARDIGDRVRVGRTPQGIGPSIAFDCWIEGVEHDIRPGFWETRWKLSRADAQTYWILGDATYGLLGTTTTLGF